MSLLPEYEDAEVSTKSLYEISLKHQIEKLLFFREKFVTSLNRPRYTNYVEPDCEYFFDSVINNSAALAEYYLPYIIYSIIGTTLTPPQRPWFSKFKNKCGEDGYQKAKSALFSKYEIGILIKSTSIDNEIYLKKCHDLFDKSIETIIEGKYDIVFTLNNYIKHNSMTFCYAPLSNTSDDKCKSNLFLSFTKDQCFMLEDSILKTLISSITNNVLIKKPNEIFAGDDFEFQTISYPSEMHMWEGLLFFEKKRGIFFSSDLMFGMGENHGQVIESSWDAAVKSSGADTLPNQESGQKLSSDLSEIEPKFVASGHGFCITIVG